MTDESAYRQNVQTFADRGAFRQPKICDQVSGLGIAWRRSSATGGRHTAKTAPSYDVAMLELGPMRYRLVSILAFIVFLANSSISSVAKAACKDHEYQTECAEDPSCTWDSGTGKKPHLGCKRLGAGRRVSFIAKLTAASGTRKIASAQARLLTTRAR